MSTTTNRPKFDNKSVDDNDKTPKATRGLPNIINNLNVHINYNHLHDDNVACDSHNSVSEFAAEEIPPHRNKRKKKKATALPRELFTGPGEGLLY